MIKTVKRKSVCKVCGKDFEYQDTQSGGIFCSKECYHQYAKGKNHPRWKKKISLMCEECNKQFEVNPSWFSLARYPKYGVRKQIFCSMVCKAEWQKKHLKGSNNPNWRGGGETKKCLNCEKLFTFPRWRLKTREVRFCSFECSLAYKGTTLPEELLLQIIKEYKFQFLYTGDGSAPIGRRYPDFSHSNGQKLVIEVFGNYWHSPLVNKRVNHRQTYEETMKHYKKHGYKCLILWDNEIKDKKLIIEKIKSFTGGV